MPPIPPFYGKQKQPLIQLFETVKTFMSFSIFGFHGSFHPRKKLPPAHVPPRFFFVGAVQDVFVVKFLGEIPGEIDIKNEFLRIQLIPSLKLR